MSSTFLKCLAGCVSLIAATPCLAQTFTFTTLQVPHAQTTNARGINDAGEVVGYYFDRNFVEHGFTESSGAYKSIDAPGARMTALVAISGTTMVGQTTSATSTSGFMLDAAGHFTTIVAPGAASTFPTGLNAAGTIVGYLFPGNGAVEEQGFVLSKGKYRLVTVPNAFDTEVNGVNSAGVFAGSYRLAASAVFQGFISNHGLFQTVSFPGAYQTSVEGINDAGVVVGYYSTSASSGYTGFTFDGKTYTSFLPPGAGTTYAFGINNTGGVVGFNFNASRRELGYVGTPSVPSSALATIGTPIQ